jgi:hypothetical protein
MPVENVNHWRRKAGDCDPWSEPEGPLHLGWKEQFDLTCREIGLVDGAKVGSPPLAAPPPPLSIA